MFGRKQKTAIDPESLNDDKPVIANPITVRPGTYKENKEVTASLAAAKMAEIQQREAEQQAEEDKINAEKQAAVEKAILEEQETTAAKEAKKEAKRRAKEAKLAARNAMEEARLKEHAEATAEEEPETVPDWDDIKPNRTWFTIVRKAYRIAVRPYVLLKRLIKRASAITWIIAGLGALLVGTQFTLMYQSKIGLYVNIASLLVLTIIALVREDLRKLSISLAILPVAQMVNSSLIINTVFRRAAVFYSVLLLLALVYRYMFTLDFPVEKTRLKLRGHTFGIPLMLTLGEIVGVIGYLFLRYHYPYHHIPLPLVASASIIFAFAEEMFLRGLIQKQAAQLTHPLVAAGLTTMLYASLAISHGTWLTIGPAIAMGAVLAMVYNAKHNLLLSVTINATAKLTYVGLVAAFVLR